MKNNFKIENKSQYELDKIFMRFNGWRGQNNGPSHILANSWTPQNRGAFTFPIHIGDKQ